MSQWAIEEKRGKTRTSDWFVTWDEFFFFRPITHRSKRKPKPSRITFDIWTKITRCLFLYLNGVGKYWYEFVRFSTLQTANRISISEDFLPLFFQPRQVLLPKNSQSVPILKVFTVHFSEIWNCFLRWGLLSVTVHNPSFLSCRPLLTNILDQWARENFYSYYKNVCKSRVNNANISAKWCQVDTKNVENLTAAIPKSCYKITLGFIDFQHFFRG